MSTKTDDLEAVRALAEALKGFDPADQERIIRWAREKLGLPQAPAAINPPRFPPIATADELPVQPGGAQNQDIRTFIASKNPQTDNHFAAAVAYFYRFVAQGEQHKEAISADDLQNATRMVNRGRLKRPDQTLVNAHNAGLLDKAGRGAYSINTVGENLVAMALPGGATGAKPLRKQAKGKKKSHRKVKHR
ncbi:MAG: hypothetical protein AB1452_03110 [Pseudomonadota bacterium]